MIKVIVFDFDGVLVESVDIKTEAFAELFVRQPQEKIEEIIRYHLLCSGVSRYEKFRHIYKAILKRPLSEKEFQSLCQRFSSLVVEKVIAAPYVPGAREFLDKYARTYACYVLSATPQEEIEQIVERRKMRGFLKKIYGAPFKKTEVVKEILREEKIMPQAAVYVGDALADYLAAKNNSVPFIARVAGDNLTFKNIDCPQLKDLRCLKEIIEKYDNNSAAA